jgi:D-arabinose 1-dehydrogenase-like Zn-dependent alcohol dehydrogenase
MTQVFPLDKVNEAYDVMMNGTVRFRAVLKINA